MEFTQIAVILAVLVIVTLYKGIQKGIQHRPPRGRVTGRKTWKILSCTQTRTKHYRPLH